MHIWFITAWALHFPPVTFSGEATEGWRISIDVWRWSGALPFLSITFGGEAIKSQRILMLEDDWRQGYSNRCLKTTSDEAIKRQRISINACMKMTGGEAIKYQCLKMTRGLPFLSITCTFGGEAIKSRRILIDAWRLPVARLLNIDAWRWSGALPFLSITCTLGGEAIKSQRISIDVWRWLWWGY